MSTSVEACDALQQTELGPLPIDWRVAEIGDFALKVGSGLTPAGGSKNYLSIGRPFVRSQNVGWGRLLLDDLAHISEASHSSFKATELRNGDVLLNITGASIGRCALADERIVGGNVNQHVCIIRVEHSEIEPGFLASVMLSQLGQKQIDSFQAGGNREGLNFKQVRSMLCPLPPSKGEQDSIATALSDADALIEGLESLIAKKRAIKQGAMQELLAAQEDWVELRLGDVAHLKARIGWQGLTTAEYLDSGEFYLVTGTDFDDGFIDWDNSHFVEKTRYDQDKYIQLKENDVLVTKDGTIGKVAFIDHLPKPTTLNSGVFVIRPVANSFQPKFLYYLLMSSAFDDFLGRLSAGSTINHLYQKDFVGFTFSVPPSSERQEEIASILLDMDLDIKAAEVRLEKARQIKRGMMQELLTGRIRLV